MPWHILVGGTFLLCFFFFLTGVILNEKLYICSAMVGEWQNHTWSQKQQCNNSCGHLCGQFIPSCCKRSCRHCHCSSRCRSSKVVNSCVHFADGKTEAMYTLQNGKQNQECYQSVLAHSVCAVEEANVGEGFIHSIGFLVKCRSRQRQCSPSLTHLEILHYIGSAYGRF